MKIGKDRNIHVEVSVRDNVIVHVYMKGPGGEITFNVSPLDAIQLSEHLLMAAETSAGFIRKKSSN